MPSELSLIHRNESSLSRHSSPLSPPSSPPIPCCPHHPRATTSSLHTPLSPLSARAPDEPAKARSFSLHRFSVPGGSSVTHFSITTASHCQSKRTSQTRPSFLKYLHTLIERQVCLLTVGPQLKSDTVRIPHYVDCFSCLSHTLYWFADGHQTQFRAINHASISKHDLAAVSLASFGHAKLLLAPLCYKEVS